MSEVVDASWRPEVGLHSGIPFAEYLDWDAASNSRLGHLLKSPAHLRTYLDSDDDSDTKARRIGRGTHAAILEPDIFGEAYVSPDDGCDFVTGSGKLCSYNAKHILSDGRAACGTHVKGFEEKIRENVVVLSESEAETIAGCREAVLSHPFAGELLEEDGENELSGLWRDDRTGVLVKLRADRVLDRGVALDLKTTTDASWPTFERDVLKYGYHRQAALYTAGLQALGRDVGHFVIIAVEKDPPHGVMVYRITDGVLDAGEEEAMLLLDLWKRCEESGRWPGYEERIHDLSFPTYGWRQVDERIELLRERKSRWDRTA